MHVNENLTALIKHELWAEINSWAWLCFSSDRQQSWVAAFISDAPCFYCNWGPDTLELQTDIRLSAGENEILLKMSDDLGQALTPEIIFRSAGSTLVNDIIHRLSCVGSTPGLKGDKQHKCPDTVVLTWYRKTLIQVFHLGHFHAKHIQVQSSRSNARFKG